MGAGIGEEGRPPYGQEELWGIHMAVTRVMGDFSAVLVKNLTGIKRTGK